MAESRTLYGEFLKLFKDRLGFSHAVADDLAERSADLAAKWFVPLEEGDPCPSCAKPMLWSDPDRMLYCEDDWEHG